MLGMSDVVGVLCGNGLDSGHVFRSLEKRDVVIQNSIQKLLEKICSEVAAGFVDLYGLTIINHPQPSWL